MTRVDRGGYSYWVRNSKEKYAHAEIFNIENKIENEIGMKRNK